MAFSNYHEKFRQIGTDPNSYESWVNANALLAGLTRLRAKMDVISPNCRAFDSDGNSFERELSIDFAEDDCITEDNNGKTVVGVVGVCDWIKEDRDATTGVRAENDVDVLEIKFVHQLSNVHRLQVLAYCALYALERREDDAYHDNDRFVCNGMLYNARTGETEICSIKTREAINFLLDISQFKYNGMDRQTNICKNTKNGNGNEVFHGGGRGGRGEYCKNKYCGGGGGQREYLRSREEYHTTKYGGNDLEGRESSTTRSTSDSACAPHSKRQKILDL